MKEYNGLTLKQKESVLQKNEVLPLYFCRLIIQFENFVNPMYYSSRDIKQIELYNFTKTPDDNDDSIML